MNLRRIETVATSNADDAAFRALADVAEITKQIDDVRIVGGHMASLLLTAFPVGGAVHRRTADADAAVSTSVAASGRIHRALVDAGYADTSGNHYVKGDLEIDILVPSDGARFETATVGGRGFDAAPGHRLAFSVDPLVLDVGVILTDGTRLDFVVRVPRLSSHSSSRPMPPSLATRRKTSQISTTSCRSRSSIRSPRSGAGRLEPFPCPERGSTPLESCMPWRTLRARALSWTTRACLRTGWLRSSGHSSGGRCQGPTVSLARRGEAELRDDDARAFAEHSIEHRYPANDGQCRVPDRHHRPCSITFGGMRGRG